MTAHNFNAILDQFREALIDCYHLYKTSARDCAELHPNLIPVKPHQFKQLMRDLHIGLLVKIYATVAEADKRWSPEEQKMSQVLIKHLWGEDLSGDELRKTVGRLFKDSYKLTWKELIRPFNDIAPLRDRFGELETVIMRVANLVAKADGNLPDSEALVLRAIQAEIQKNMRPIPIDEPSQHAKASQLGPQAVQTMQAEAKQQGQHYQHVIELEPVEEIRSPEEKLEEAMAMLNQLIGLKNLKKEIRTLTNYLKMQEQRKLVGLPQTQLSLHMVFTGNPGTGKTTLARIIGQIYGAMGVLKKGHLIETDRSGLVAEFIGRTGPKTNKIIDEALDGVLFIDEAYSLAPEKGDDPFGPEAVQTLLKRMEDDRDRLVVILAGYPEPMEALLLSNPGLSSRINTKMPFDDYSANELGKIFGLLCEKNHYEVSSEVQAKLLLGFKWLYTHRDEHFGNGRLVRNTFETAVRNLANRIADITPVTKELLTVFEHEDIQLTKVPNEIWDRLDDDDLRFRAACEGCEKESTIPKNYLGKRLQCKKCDDHFIVSWGEPSLDLS